MGLCCDTASIRAAVDYVVEVLRVRVPLRRCFRYGSTRFNAIHSVPLATGFDLNDENIFGVGMPAATSSLGDQVLVRILRYLHYPSIQRSIANFEMHQLDLQYELSHKY